jgi:hypothetical protein
VIEVFIDELDLAALGFSGMTPAATGRPAYHPSTLLKIYLYGYLNRVQSSRHLEREAGSIRRPAPQRQAFDRLFGQPEFDLLVRRRLELDRDRITLSDGAFDQPPQFRRDLAAEQQPFVVTEIRIVHLCDQRDELRVTILAGLGLDDLMCLRPSGVLCPQRGEFVRCHHFRGFRWPYPANASHGK